MHATPENIEVYDNRELNRWVVEVISDGRINEVYTSSETQSGAEADALQTVKDRLPEYAEVKVLGSHRQL